MGKRKITRRRFLEGTGAALAAAAVSPSLKAQTATQRAASASAVSAAPRTSITLTVNGAARKADVEDRWTLVELLRDHLQLTGTKIGCDRGECGACTVLLDGKPVYSCSQLAVWADGKSVQTVEGLITDGKLDPLQQSFVDRDAPQCGFCTSGQLMSAKALLNTNPHPTADDVRAALTGNLCRCANYNHYVAAVVGSARPSGERSAEAIALQSTFAVRAAALKTVGHATPRIDAVERSTGKAAYTGDIQLPGMLYARVLRSPHAHARILKIDTSKAAALPGVKAVISHENCRVVWGAGSVAGGQQYSDEVKKNTKQRRYAFNNPVRFAGEPVAAVAAVDRHTAEEALQLIAVDYDVLEHVLDQEAALKPDAVKIWPEGNLSLNNRNEAVPISQKRGDVEAGFKGADQVFEGRFSTAFVHNAQMEIRSA
ncbi:MAG TPA: 2Fe-2S iron-sulfur cluster-binding protein, partial [Vicinamibacterales bacterium]|nr:2Fe-2S iron-sulfur cluster-binding protein [Vicinamibacterales bacterium]